MTDISTNFGESKSNSNIDDSSREKNTENVVCEEPPRYQSLCSESKNYPSTPITVRPFDSTLTYNINSTSAVIAPQPNITQSNGKIESYTIWSIFNILCCCLCLGCLACYYSNKTTSLKRRGNIQGALNASNTARTVNIISTTVGIFFILIYLVYTAYSSSKY